MADHLTKKQRSAHMAKIRSKRTKPEMRVHNHLKGRKVRHVMWPIMWGSPDIYVFDQTLVFVNGCFWHGCRRHWRCPKTNSGFWADKIARNKVRQDRVVNYYRHGGFKVVVLWEHDLAGGSVEKALARITQKRP